MLRIPFILAITFTTLCLGQGKNEIWLQGRFKAGFLAAHRSIMGHIPSEHAFAGELSYMVQSKGQKAWHHGFNLPTYGGTFFGGSVGNRELLGHYFGGYGFVNFPLIKRKHYVMSFKTGAGLGYGTKVYDAQTNILSMAISTHMNALVVFAWESRIRFGNHSAKIAVDMTHFSNGASKVPNLGLNLPYLSLGYGYRIQESNHCDTCIQSEPMNHKRWEYGLMAYGSTKEVFPVGGKKYPILGLNLVGRRFFGPTTGMEVSFDVISKQAIMAFNPDVPKTQLDILQLGVFAGYLLPMDRLHLVIGMGAYIRDKYRPEDKFYHRVGMRYVFDNGINLNLVLKSHWARADYIEYGIGYTFKK